MQANGLVNDDDAAVTSPKPKPKRWMAHYFYRFRPVRSGTYSHFHVTVFLLTYISYALIHAVRKSFSNVKVLVAEEWSPSKTPKEPAAVWNSRDMFESSDSPTLKAFLGVLDTTFMIVYSVSMYLGGMLGDRIDLRYLLCFCMGGASLSVLMFGSVAEWLSLYSPYWYVTWWIINAAFQGPIWPCLLAIMGGWFGKKNRGFVLGLWSSNSSAGNIVGSLMVAQFVDVGYELAMLVPSIVTLGFTIIIFFGMAISPSEVGLSDKSPVGSQTIEPKKDESQQLSHSSEAEIAEDEVGILEEIGMMETIDQIQHKQDVLLAENSEGEVALSRQGSVYRSTQSVQKLRPVGFFEALLLPGVIVYSLSYACLKLVNYAFFFWLPFYLNRTFHWSQADSDSLSIFYDIGGIVGAIIGGLLSDLWRRAPVMFAMLSLGIPVIIFYTFLPDSMVFNAIVLFVIGFCIGGVANLLSSAVAADLGRHPKLNNSKSALATVSGIIDGTGSAGAAIGQIAIPLISTWFGWTGVFAMLVVCSVVCTLGVGRMVWAECTVLHCKKGHKEGDAADEKTGAGNDRL